MTAVWPIKFLDFYVYRLLIKWAVLFRPELSELPWQLMVICSTVWNGLNTLCIKTKTDKHGYICWLFNLMPSTHERKAFKQIGWNPS
jgi:hypothetical protein